jgi:ubiquinone/menaquinone biosynthesis C-methylase UbiE
MKPFDPKLMRAHWEAEALKYSQNRKWSAVDDQVLDLITPFDNIKMLEIGIGSGLMAQEIIRKFPSVHYLGLDISFKFIEISLVNLAENTPLIQATALSLPFKAQSFDLVLEMDSIHHFPNKLIPEAVGEIHRILKAKGHFLLAEDWALEPKNEREELALFCKNRRHLTLQGWECHPSENEWRTILQDSDLSIRKVEYIPRPLDLQTFANINDIQGQRELSRLEKMWEGCAPYTRMILILSQKA